MNSPKNSSSPVAVILVHYGKVETTLRCIDSLIRANGKKSVFIANNGPTHQGERIAAHLREHRHAINGAVIQNPRNLGFAAGCNAALKKALETDAEAFWLLNNDTLMTSGAMKALVEQSQETPRAILGSTVVHMDAPETIAVAGGFTYNPATTVINACHAGQHVTDRQKLGEPPLDYIYGASLFMTRMALEETGLLDETFFLYYEELDLCDRALKAGYALHWCRESIVLHRGGAATGTRTGDTGPASRTSVFHEARSTMLYTRKHHPWCLPAAIAARIIGKPFFLVTRREWQNIIPAVLGAWNGLTARRAPRG